MITQRLLSPRHPEQALYIPIFYTVFKI